MKQHMVRHFKTKHRALFLKLQPIMKKTPHSISAMKAYNSWVKKYSTEIGDRKFRCDLCQKVLNMPKAHGNMKRHICVMHPKVYEMETQMEQEPFKQCFKTKSSDVESWTEIEKDEGVLELEEEGIVQEEYIVEYLDEKYDNDERSVIVETDPDKEKELIEEGEASKENDSADDEEASLSSIRLRILKKKPDTDTVESPIPQEIAYQDVDEVKDYGDIEYISDKDSEYEEKIKWLAQRIVLGKKFMKTCIWNFFTEVSTNHIYKCIFCRREISIFPYSSSNLKRHLSKIHARAFQLIVKHGPEFKTKTQASINKLLESTTSADDITKSFESSYFVAQGDNMYKCKNCDEVINSDAADSLVLFKHIHEKHSDEVLSRIKNTVDDDEEFSVLFVKKKDLLLA